MANFQLDPEGAVNDLLDQIAFVQREKAAVQMQLSAAMKLIDQLQKSQEKGDEVNASDTV